jgi:MFS family permease
MRRGRRPYLALRNRDFRLLGIATLFSLVGTQMQNVAVDWHIYLLTHSPLALGFVGLTRVVPTIALSLAGGIVADRLDRKIVMFASESVMAVSAVALAWVTFRGGDSLAWIYGLTAVNAAANAFDGPARQALVPRLVPKEDLPGALSINLTFFHAALIGGPAITGLMLVAGGRSVGTARPVLGAIYAMNAVSFGAVLLALLAIRTSGRMEAPASGAEHPVAALRAGLRFVFRTPIMVSTMALDFFATFFAGALALLPIIADQVLHAGASGYGWLRAAPAVGALAGSVLTTVHPLPRRQGRVFLWAVVAYGAATVVYGLSRSFALTFAALAATGFADLISTVIRQTLRQIITPDELRGRMTSVNMIFFMGGPQLGEMEAGFVASLFPAAVGAVVSVVSGGLATIAVAAVIAAVAPVVRKYDLSEYIPDSAP